LTQYISNQINMSKPLKIFKPKKMELTIDARDIFCSGKNARVIHIVFTIRDNIVFQKIESFVLLNLYVFHYLHSLKKDQQVY
jgi:pectate lyase